MRLASLRARAAERIFDHRSKDVGRDESELALKVRGSASSANSPREKEPRKPGNYREFGAFFFVDRAKR